MIVYRPFEMHTHTVHSDGQFTLESLCEAAKSYLYDGIALTDHNTWSAFDGLPETPVIHGIPVIRGLEWTTFFGHMQVLYADEYVDWRKAVPDNIDSFTEKIHAVNGIVGIVHPFEMGSPMCTGCYFDFKVKNWDAIDYIEVWSKRFPTQRYETPYAVEMWTKLLNKGHRITITAGRDWHREPEDHREHAAATYIGLKDGVVSSETVREAFHHGRIFLTCGPRLDVILQQDGQNFTMGDVLKPGQAECQLHLDREARKAAWEEFGIIPLELRAVMNGNTVFTTDCGRSDDFSFILDIEPGWLRFEIWGKAIGESDKQLVLTSPFYCE